MSSNTIMCSLENAASRQLDGQGWRRLVPSSFLFFLIPVLVGMVPGGLSFAFNPNVVIDIGLNQFPVPGWFFTPVWIVIYGGMGVAIWTLFRQPIIGNACIPVAVLIAGFIQTHLFWFTDSLRATAVTDATGLVLAATAFWVVSQYSHRAMLWLLPWLIWMPITLVIKLAAINGAFI